MENWKIDSMFEYPKNNITQLIRDEVGHIITMAEEYKPEFEEAGEISEELAKCQTDCSLKEIFEIERTPEEQMLIDFIEDHINKETGIACLDERGINAYIRDCAIREFMKQVRMFFHTDSTIQKSLSLEDYNKVVTKYKVKVADKTFVING